MEALGTSEVLFYGGLGVMAAAALLAVAATAVLHLTGKRLRNRLEEEFGPRRH